MATTHAPAFQFYTGDWRKDPAVQSLDHQHKGVWIDLLCMMWDSFETGRLVILNGAAMPDDAIARNLGISEAEWKQIRGTLLSYGVASEDEDGVLYNRRMARDEDLRQKRAEAGRKGGLVSKPASKTEAKGGSSSSSSSSTKEKIPIGSKRKASLPDSWNPSDGHRKRAEELGLDLDDELENFHLHAKATGRLQVDWSAAFYMWLKKAVDFGNGRQRGNGKVSGALARPTIFELGLS